MEITRTSIFSQNTRTWDLDITEHQLDLYENQGVYIQHAMPHLSDDEREFILTGITPEEWCMIFPDDDEPSIEDHDEPAF